MASNEEQKNSARAKREAAEATAAATARRNRLVGVLGGVVFAAVLVVLVVVFVSGGKDPVGGAGPGRAEGDSVEGTAETRALLQGVPQDGFTLGDAKAPVTILEFLDVQCPFCRDHQIDQQPRVIRELVRTGKAKLRAVPIALPNMGEDSEAGRIVAAKLADDDKAWNFLNLFYWNQGPEGTGYVTNDYLTDLVAAAGGPAADAGRTATPAVQKQLDEIDALAQTLNVSGTPSFYVGRSSAAPNTYDKVEASGTNSVVDGLIERTNELAGAGSTGT